MSDIMSDSKSGLLTPETKQRPRHRRLTRRATVRPASIFTPQHANETPEHHFPLQTVYTRTSHPRFVNRYDSHEILIVVDGSCLNNGRKDAIPQGGCSFRYKGAGGAGDVNGTGLGSSASSFGFSGGASGGARGGSGTVGFPLETRGGPGGEATSNRAKLQAVITALEFRPWHEAGWRRVVVATDLEYVVRGATEWLPQWVRQRWRKHPRRAAMVANRDLWEELNGVVESLRAHNIEVSFWLISSGSASKLGSALIKETKHAARKAAAAQQIEQQQQQQQKQQQVKQQQVEQQQVEQQLYIGEFSRLCGITK